ncbi:MAG TPA: chloride channel protein [Myxococcales bacterium]|nr:chloride channel protein [Myxococcales bacterium]
MDAAAEAERKRPDRVTGEWRRRAGAGLELLNRLRLPGPSVLPVAGAVVGLYAGLAAGLFANLVGLMGGLFFRLPRAFGAQWDLGGLREALLEAPWHTEYAILGAPVAAVALFAAKRIRPGGPRDEVKRRLRVLALLVLGALGLYYPLVAVSALNAAYGMASEAGPMSLPFWAVILLPLAGGALVGRMLRDRPDLHGHGVPEVVQTVRAERGLQGSGGLLKLFASAVTIGSGGSGGREGPIVYGGAAFASAVGETLGFSRRELAILLASGAGAGIAASFNAPIAGAIFGMEIILREFELRVFSPIILASVTATMVGRGLMHAAPMLHRLPYSMVSGWEVVAYAALGLLCGVLAYALIRCMRWVEALFGGRLAGRLLSGPSAWLGRRPGWLKAALGGGLTGVMVLASPAVWGTGHDSLNLAAEGKLGLWALVLGCGLKLVGTSLTIGSGGSGGTFFPATVVGGMAGGALGTVLHRLLPAAVAPSGAYALVGMGGAVAGFNRAPLTGMMMLYELSGNYAVILPLMVTCTISSALCHALSERSQRSPPTEAELLRTTPVRELMREAPAVSVSTPVRALLDLLVASRDFALPVRTGAGKIHGVVQLHHLQEVWPDAALQQVLNAWDVAQPVPVLHPDVDLRQVLATMDEHDIDVLPVLEADGPGEAVFLVTRAAVRRFLHKHRAPRPEAHTIAPTELS